MAERIDLTIDKQGRMSVGRLGMGEGHAVAEALPDGSGWVIRPATLLTEAEVEVLSDPSSRANLERALEDLAGGRTQPRRPS
jgi:hypothetical protein